MKKKYTLEDIKTNQTVEIIEEPATFTDCFGNTHNIDEVTEQADSDVELIKMKSRINFRWNEFEVRRAKEIARKLGIPYQSYIKMTLKQAMDLDEQKYN